jgi:hypothetical protein
MSKSLSLLKIIILILIVSCSTNTNKPLLISDVSSEKHDKFNKANGINDIIILPVFKKANKPNQNLNNRNLGLPDDELTMLLIRSFDIYTNLNIGRLKSVLYSLKNELGEDLEDYIVLKNSINKTTPANELGWDLDNVPPFDNIESLKNRIKSIESLNEETSDKQKLIDAGYSESDAEDFVDEFKQGGVKVPQKVKDIIVDMYIM